jgi:hypothetical protein
MDAHGSSRKAALFCKRNDVFKLTKIHEIEQG